MGSLTNKQRHRLEVLLAKAGIRVAIPVNPGPVNLSKREIKRIEKMVGPDPIVIIKKPNKQLRTYTLENYQKIGAGMRAWHKKRKEVVHAQ